jgi:hypothetical protein
LNLGNNTAAGGIINIISALYVGNWLCKVKAEASNSVVFDESFKFSLTISLPTTVPDPPTALTAIPENANSS